MNSLVYVVCILVNKTISGGPGTLFFAMGNEIRRVVMNVKNYHYSDAVSLGKRIQAIDIDPYQGILTAKSKKMMLLHSSSRANPREVDESSMTHLLFLTD